MPYPMKKNQNLARSVAPHYPLPTTTDSNVSDRANLSEVGYGKGEWIENMEGDLEWAPDECEHKNTEWVPAEPENNVEEDLFCLDCNESLPLEFDHANI
jgi:hypothetical protein|tara:strand:+ start:2722 stop:3018 length:297 start_codon:yes stop_codon:yes gene_type:complete